MKKIISSLLVILVLFNFIFCSDAYAKKVDFQGLDSVKDDYKASSLSDMALKGVGNGISIVWDILGGIFGTIAGIIAIVANLFPAIMQAIMGIACDLKIKEMPLTIEKIVFNEVNLFNINYFDFDIGTDLLKSVKGSIAKWFVIIRLIAIVINLLVLIYVGIRMAISTVASDKIKYKKMLIGWFESIVILFTMQYIISIILNVGEVFSDIVNDLRDKLDDDISFETKILDDITSNMLGSKGWLYALNSVSYWFLVFIQSKFFLMYFKRVITVGFLIVVSPLITVTYSIDKIGDNKAQAFSVWLNEFMMNVFIQPVHALIYLVFLYTAGEIAKHSMLVALVFLISLTKVEKIILQLFNLKNVVSLRPVDEHKLEK